MKTTLELDDAGTHERYRCAPPVVRGTKAPSTHPCLFTPPSSLDQAIGDVEALPRSPAARLLTPGATFVEPLVLSEERDFARFPGLERAGLED